MHNSTTNIRLYCDTINVFKIITGEATGVGGLNLPLSSGATHKICAEPMKKYWGTPHPVMSYLRIRLSLSHIL